MLVITRRMGERVMIGRDITVGVLRIIGNQVTLGIDAPRSVPINREEIFHRLKKEGRTHVGPLPMGPDPPVADPEKPLESLTISDGQEP